jgi:primosomal protein N'
MKLIQVIPIARGIMKESLSYFSKHSPPAGALVSVPIRNRLRPALVYAIEDVRDVKTRLRQSPYPIKKIDEITATALFLPEFMEAVSRTALYTAGTTGAVLSSLVPRAILSDPKKVSGHTIPPRTKRVVPTYEKLVLQTDRDERFATYKSLIRESFARKQSIFICMPTLFDVEKFMTQSEKGIKSYTFAFHSALSKKQVFDRWNKAVAEKHPIIIVGTGSFLSIPRRDIRTIVIERESASAYKALVRPFVDIRVFGGFLAHALGARVVFADSFLRIETLYNHYEGDSAELSPLRFRPLTPARQTIIDMKAHAPTLKGRYDIISGELGQLAETTRRNSEHLFVYAARKGLAPITVCCECGAVVTSSYSDAPMVLHKTSRGNIFMCHQNGEIRSANECCKKCGSWKLTALGGGIELVEEQVAERLPSAHIFRIDGDATTTHKQAERVSGEWYDTPGSILIGTEMALPYITEPIENIAVASIDSMLSIPDFKIETKMFSILLTIRALAEKEFLIQTRNPGQRVLRDVLAGNLMEFYREEINTRAQLGYPPFSLFIKLTVSGIKQAVADKMAELESTFADYDFRVFSAFTPAPHGKQTSHALIKLPVSKWPDTGLITRLQALPPQITVQVDPESIL